VLKSSVCRTLRDGSIMFHPAAKRRGVLPSIRQTGPGCSGCQDGQLSGGVWRIGAIDTSVLYPALGTPALLMKCRCCAPIDQLLSHSAADDQDEMPDDHLPCCEAVDVSAPAHVNPECCGAFDRLFPKLSLAGRVDDLAAGDSGILALADAFSVPILSPTALGQRCRT